MNETDLLREIRVIISSLDCAAYSRFLDSGCLDRIDQFLAQGNAEAQKFVWDPGDPVPSGAVVEESRLSWEHESEDEVGNMKRTCGNDH